MRFYLTLWILISLLLGFEYWALAHHPDLSLLIKMQHLGWIGRSVNLNINRGGFVSLWTGWIGFGLMVIMNLYSVRRRLGAFFHFGRVSSWLNFHIFCGLLGPTLILFHCGLKVRGLVAISFWSMVISFSSGIIGRYFYLQLSQKKSELETAAAAWLKKLESVLIKNNIQTDPKVKALVLAEALSFVGGQGGVDEIGPISAFVSSCVGDIRLMFSEPSAPKNWPQGKSKLCLMNYAIATRKAKFLHTFQKLMGHWHAFHFPFAIFMYLTAIVHIISSLIFPKM